jgi:L-seryl-tRNA(Ser) seleniumtransferase
MNKQNLLREIPKVDEMLTRPAFAGLGEHLLLGAVRQVLGALREGIVSGAVSVVPPLEELEKTVLSFLAKDSQSGLQRVINGTGIILHTNLGRAPLAQEALDAINETARGYSNLEYNVNEAKRGSRHAHVEGLLAQLSGAEAAMAVNNNAAAVLLALSAAANNRDVIISRGELVEIGGSFRIPDVMEQSGCRLVEIGTTNKTHLHDYKTALEAGGGRVRDVPSRLDSFAVIAPLGIFDPRPHGNIGAVLRVHASNFKMSGFVSRPALNELAALVKGFGVPLIEDLGSGALLPVHGQPTVADSIKAGADIVTFSGDKLLGGPQAGIIAGRADLIEKMKKHPLARALRIDKLSLAALEATLRLYLHPKTAAEKIPTLQMLNATEDELYKKAERLATLLNESGSFSAEILRQPGQAGGGAMPEENLLSAVVALTHADKTAQELEQCFRENSPPIIGRIAQGRFLLDVRTIAESDFAEICGVTLP